MMKIWFACEYPERKPGRGMFFHNPHITGMVCRGCYLVAEAELNLHPDAPPGWSVRRYLDEMDRFANGVASGA